MGQMTDAEKQATLAAENAMKDLARETPAVTNFPQRPPAPRGVGHMRMANDRLVTATEAILREHQQTNQTLARTNQLLEKLVEALS